METFSTRHRIIADGLVPVVLAAIVVIAFSLLIFAVSSQRHPAEQVGVTSGSGTLVVTRIARADLLYQFGARAPIAQKNLELVTLTITSADGSTFTTTAFSAVKEIDALLSVKQLSGTYNYVVQSVSLLREKRGGKDTALPEGGVVNVILLEKQPITKG